VAVKGNYPMAVRHDVQNLIRRGNIFYRRARVPQFFHAIPAGQPAFIEPSLFGS